MIGSGSSRSRRATSTSTEPRERVAAGSRPPRRPPAFVQLSGVPCRLVRRNPPCRRISFLGIPGVDLDSDFGSLDSYL